MERVIVSTLLVLSFAVCVGSCSENPYSSALPEENSAGNAPVPTRMLVEVAEVQRQDVTENLELTGTVKPWDEFAISSEIMGTVVAIHFDEGDWVEKGDLLLELDRSKLELQLRTRRADLQRAEVELDFAKRHLSRGQALLDKGAISQSDVDNLQERVNLSASSVEVSKLAVESVKEDLKDTEIFSPATGQLSRRVVSLGETVTPASMLFRLLQLDPIKVLTEITEPYLAEIRPGQMVQLQFDAFQAEGFTGHVHKIQPVASVESGAFPLEVRLSNSRRRLQSGMTAKISLRGRIFAEALVVPLESVVNLEGEDFVFVVNEGRAHRRPVVIREHVDKWAIVDANLEPGEQVVTRGNSNLTDGTSVEMII